jgi:ABC-type branched-subunit amino acid transport system substrate-binding protein
MDVAVVDLALVVPLHGSAGIFGPSCELCAQLAVSEINAGDGVLGRQLRLSVVDGSGSPSKVADEVGALAAAGLVDAVVGWHISAVRQAVAPRVAEVVPYVYTALYEGGERTPGVFLTGEVPSRQLLPAMEWLHREQGVRRWCIVGNDYVWPRETARAARVYAKLCEGQICHEVFAPLGCRSWEPIVGAVGRSRPDAVIMLLVGEDAVLFNRAFAAAGLDARCRRLSTLIDENTLAGSGAESTRGICAAAAYFETLTTPESLDFGWRYTRRFGPDAPTLNSVGESCYEGVLLLSELARRADSLDVGRMTAAAESLSYSGPRGEVRMRDRHLDQRIYLAEANELQFDLVTQL